MYYRKVADLNEIILKRLSIIPRDIDLIVGIPRSGMLPANLLALYLNKPLSDIHSFLNGHIYKAGERGQFFAPDAYRKILVVDDSISSGSAMSEAKKQLSALEDNYDIRYCAVYVIPGKEKLVDYFFELVPLPRYFQWNIFNHIFLEKACFDIDGVLCVDPAPEQNDDGPRYRDFLLNAQPLYIPGCPIGTLVTSRLEKYRQETVLWLQKYNIRYKELIMLDLPDMEARQKANNHAEFKASVYKASPYVLFVESSLRQAREINVLAKKPVYCTENFEMIYDSESAIFNVISGKSLPFLRKFALSLRNTLRKNKKQK